MLHETLEHLNSEKNWQWWIDNYETMGFEASRGRLLLNKNRRKNQIAFLNDIARIYKKAQKRFEDFYNGEIIPILDEAKSRAKDGKVILHAKPSHKFEPYRNYTWWAYNYRDSGKTYGWGYSFDWIEEPQEKINHDLGQVLYDSQKKSDRFSGRALVLEQILKAELEKYIYNIYPYKWLDENHFTGRNKIVKFTLCGDQYWYKISYSRHGVPIWENFIWQSNGVEEIDI